MFNPSFEKKMCIAQKSFFYYLFKIALNLKLDGLKTEAKRQLKMISRALPSDSKRIHLKKKGEQMMSMFLFCFVFLCKKIIK